MKRVYKCDYCTDTDDKPEKILAHEKTCYMNPLAKDCGTCKNQERIPYELAWECKYGWEFQDEKEAPCEKWELNRSK